MKLYKLCMRPDESSGEGEDWSEWFSSLAEAKTRRAERIRETLPMEREDHVGRMLEGFTGEDFEIEEHTIRDGMPAKALLLAALNRRGFSVSSREVVPPARFNNGRRVRQPRS